MENVLESDSLSMSPKGIDKRGENWFYLGEYLGICRVSHSFREAELVRNRDLLTAILASTLSAFTTRFCHCIR